MEARSTTMRSGDTAGKGTTGTISGARTKTRPTSPSDASFCSKFNFSFPRHYDVDCKGKRTPECTANKWIVENIPNGEYEATIGVRHNTAAFILDMQVNGAIVFNSKNVEIKGKDGKNGAWTESSVVT